MARLSVLISFAVGSEPSSIFYERFPSYIKFIRRRMAQERVLGASQVFERIILGMTVGR